MVAIAVGVPIFLISKLVDAVGWVVPILGATAIVGVAIWYQQNKKRQRLEYLRGKYKSEEIVLFQGTIWQGQSDEQLRDTLGDPVAVDRAVYKAKKKETWKYRQTGANRFGLRITVEDGHVVGWDKKA